MTHLRRSDDDDEKRSRGARFAYLREPEAIYRVSFAIIDQETDWAGLPLALRPVARRMIHACGMPDVVRDLAWSEDVVAAATAALIGGAAVLADCRMVAAGITRAKLPAANPIHIALDRLPADHDPVGTTRSAAAIDAAADLVEGAVVVVGNAPTALFRLLERCEAAHGRPAVILGFPVGFVGAAESKRALATSAPAPFLTLHGRRGGSAIAAAAVNALADLAGARHAASPA